MCALMSVKMDDHLRFHQEQLHSDLLKCEHAEVGSVFVTETQRDGKYFLTITSISDCPLDINEFTGRAKRVIERARRHSTCFDRLISIFHILCKILFRQHNNEVLTTYR